jgi:hypothetical protein
MTEQPTPELDDLDALVQDLRDHEHEWSWDETRQRINRFAAQRAAEAVERARPILGDTAIRHAGTVHSHSGPCKPDCPATPPPGDAVTLMQQLQAAYDAVKDWPEARGDPRTVGDAGFMDLLALRNLVPAAIAALTAAKRTEVPPPGDAGERAREIADEMNCYMIEKRHAGKNGSAYDKLVGLIAAALQSERTAAAPEIAKLTDERDDAQFHVRDMVATNAAMAAERDRAKNNLEHWRQEVGKLHSLVDRLTKERTAAASQARRETIEECARACRGPGNAVDAEQRIRALATSQESAS